MSTATCFRFGGSTFDRRLGNNERDIAPAGSRSIFVLQDRFDHFQHHHREALVWKLPSDSPALPVIELDRRSVQLENAKPEYSTTATNNFSFGVCQQPLANSASATFAKHP